MRAESYFSWKVPEFLLPLKSFKLRLGSSELNSLHFEIDGHLVSQTVANALSTIPPQNIVSIGLDIWFGIFFNPIDMEHLERLAKTLQTRGFVKLRRIHVRLASRSSGGIWVTKLRQVFPAKLLSVESLPEDGILRYHASRSLTDDSYQSLI